MGFHYKYSASAAHRWMNCHGFKALESKAPKRTSSKASQTGTAAHYLGEWALRNGYGSQVDETLIGARVRLNTEDDAFAIVAGPDTPCRASYSGIGWVNDASKTSKDYPTVIEVDESMVRAVAKYTSIIGGIMAKYKGLATGHIEMKFELTKDIGGMSDMTIQAPGRLIVLDYKNGYNVVNAENNPQLAMYGVGALKEFSQARLQIDDVVMGIVQPNAPGPTLSTWTQTTAQMVGWNDRFEAARYSCEQAKQDFAAGKPMDRHLTTGSHCKWCPAMVLCPAKQREALVVANQVLNDLPAQSTTATPDPASLGDSHLLWLAEHGESIIEFINGCREHMTTQAVTQGKQWAGYKLVEGQTKRRLKDKDGLAAAFKARGLMQAFEPRLKAVSKLEKIFGKEKMAPLIERPRGTLQLVPDTDKRQPQHTTALASLPALPEVKK